MSQQDQWKGRIRRSALAAACLLALGGCQREAGEESAEIFTGPQSGEEDAFELQPLSAEDLTQAVIEGELGCAFATDSGANPLLVARGFVADEEGRAQALIKHGDALMSGRAVEPGGYDAIIRGASFDTGGMMIDVVRISDEPAGQGESPPYPALLRATEPIRGENIFEGYWTCGP